MGSEWLPIDTAPKDGTRILWGGRWKPFDHLPGGEWHEIIVTWTTVMSDRTAYQWMTDSFTDPVEHYHVNWTHWQPLPPPPGELT